MDLYFFRIKDELRNTPQALPVEDQWVGGNSRDDEPGADRRPPSPAEAGDTDEEADSAIFDNDVI